MKTKAFDKTDWRSRYLTTYRQWQERQNYTSPKEDWPNKPPGNIDIKTANGLKSFILDFLTWKGWRATRINTQGQFVQQKYNGRVVSSGWRKGQTKKGTGDISATINGKSVWLEIKIGKDTPSSHQLKRQAEERAAGGTYEFISSPEQFLDWYDSFSVISQHGI